MVDKLKVARKAAPIIFKRVAQFADACALAAVSGYSIHEALQHKGNWYKALLFAGILIALQAFVLLVKHFNQPTTAEYQLRGGK